MLDLRKIKDVDFDPKDCMWREVETKGDEKPGCLAHHSSVVHGDRMFLFGGSNLEQENRKFFSLDLNSYKWDLVKSRGDLPATRDEHTAVVFENESSMIVFGGFCNGERTNEAVKYLFQENRWVKINQQGTGPSPRSGHSACVYEGCMYVFGGKDEDNNKLNDLWKLDLNTYTWTEVKSSDSFLPLERSGHSCDVFESYMVIFGGIFEITKELNDLHLFDFKKQRWVTLFEEANSPKRELSPYQQHEDSSPGGSMSPAKKSHNGVSPLGRKASPPKQSRVKVSSQKIKKALNLNTSTAAQSRNTKTNIAALLGGQLTTPTSISMMNSFIIKNADTSFDHYYSSMKKRKQVQGLNSTFA